MSTAPADLPTQARRRDGRPRPLAVLVGLVIVVSAVGLLAVLLFPWQSLTSQRRSIDHAADTLERLQAETSHLAVQVAEAKDPVVVERIAREQLSLVREGDTLYRLNVDPADVITLPSSWPLPGVAHLLGDGED
ncbi:MAG: septum formation initiator family protein [Acidimicrobiaceae bacterium]|nr:septum formation initiator family protein [Acidimicrobiaceae bacterium]